MPPISPSWFAISQVVRPHDWLLHGYKTSLAAIPICAAAQEQTPPNALRTKRARARVPFPWLPSSCQSAPVKKLLFLLEGAALQRRHLAKKHRFNFLKSISYK